LYDVATDTNTTTAAIFPYPTVIDPFIGVVLLPNGQVFCVPWNSQRAYIFDPVTLTATSTTASFPAGSAYSGGTLLPDGNVYCFPASSTTARIYDYRTGVVRSPNVTFPGNYAFLGGCLLPCGRVLLRPNSSTTARVHDVVTDTVSTPTGAALVPTSEAVLVPDGRIVLIPSRNNAIRYIHTGGWGTYKLPMNVLTSPYMNTNE
jgi:hypothetical protein